MTTTTLEQDLAARQSASVRQVQEELRQIVTEQTPLTTVVDRLMGKLQVGEATVREGIVGMLYTGELTLSDDRQLAPTAG